MAARLTPGQAQRAIRRCIEAGAVIVSLHALDAAEDEGLERADIIRLLSSAIVSRHRSHPGRFVCGAEGHLVVVEVEDRPMLTIVVTLFYP